MVNPGNNGIAVIPTLNLIPSQVDFVPQMPICDVGAGDMGRAGGPTD